MGACFHTQDVSCDNCRGFNINIGSGHGGTCNCQQCRHMVYIPAVPVPPLVPYGDMKGPPPMKVEEMYASMNEAVERRERAQRRERIATAILSGIVSGIYSVETHSALPSVAAEQAVKLADALIEELDKRDER